MLSNIALYDIDFWHSPHKVPNLELMKVFNYFYQNGDQVIFIEPNEPIRRFSQVIYFKESPSLRVPKNIDLIGDNIKIYGYGFYKKFVPLKEPFCDAIPTFLPYDFNQSKIKNLRKYNQIKKGSLIRIENQDFSYFNPESSQIFIVDQDGLYQENLEGFYKEYGKKYNITFLHNLVARDEQTLRKYCKVFNNQIYVDFYCDENLILNFLNEPQIVFPAHPYENEKSYSMFLQRIVNTILQAKKQNAVINFSSKPPLKKDIKNTPLCALLKPITIWGMTQTQLSFFDFIRKTNSQLLPSIQNKVLNEKELRISLKQNPVSYKS